MPLFPVVPSHTCSTPLSSTSQVQSLPGILIFRFVAPLCYVNAMVFRKRLVTAAGVDPALTLTEEVDGCLMVGFKKVCVFVCVCTGSM